MFKIFDFHYIHIWTKLRIDRLDLLVHSFVRLLSRFIFQMLHNLELSMRFFSCVWLLLFLLLLPCLMIIMMPLCCYCSLSWVPRCLWYLCRALWLSLYLSISLSRHFCLYFSPVSLTLRSNLIPTRRDALKTWSLVRLFPVCFVSFFIQIIFKHLYIYFHVIFSFAHSLSSFAIAGKVLVFASFYHAIVLVSFGFNLFPW